VDLDLGFVFEPKEPWRLMDGPNLWPLGPGAITGATPGGWLGKAGVFLEYSGVSGVPVLRGTGSETLSSSLRILDADEIATERENHAALVADGYDASDAFGELWSIRDGVWRWAHAGIRWTPPEPGWRLLTKRESWTRAAAEFVAHRPETGEVLAIWPVHPSDPLDPMHHLTRATALFTDELGSSGLAETKDDSESLRATNVAPTQKIEPSGPRHPDAKLAKSTATLVREEEVVAVRIVQGLGLPVVVATRLLVEKGHPRRVKQILRGAEPMNATGPRAMAALLGVHEPFDEEWDCRASWEGGGKGVVRLGRSCRQASQRAQLTVVGGPGLLWRNADLDAMAMAGISLLRTDSPERARTTWLQSGQVVAFLAWVGERDEDFEALAARLKID